MKFLFSDKVITWCAIAFIIMIALNKYNNQKSNQTPNTFSNHITYNTSGENHKPHAKHSINFDLNKDYKDYSLTEKAIYKIFKDDIEQAKLLGNKNQLINKEQSNSQNINSSTTNVHHDSQNTSLKK